MRIRQVKPEFWKDRAVAGLAPITRLTYIGLWMLADDAGWFRFDPPGIALELLGWEPVARREKAVEGALEQLRLAKRIVVFECGHAIVPKLVVHQRFAGETKRVYTIRREHERCPRVLAIPRGDGIPADTRGSSPTPDALGSGERFGPFGQGSSTSRERDDEDRDAILDSYRRQGLPVDA